MIQDEGQSSLSVGPNILLNIVLPSLTKVLKHVHIVELFLLLIVIVILMSHLS